MTDIRATDHLSAGETPESADAAAHRSDDESGLGKLAELLKGVHTVMFTTVDDDGRGWGGGFSSHVVGVHKGVTRFRAGHPQRGSHVAPRSSVPAGSSVTE